MFVGLVLVVAGCGGSRAANDSMRPGGILVSGSATAVGAAAGRTEVVTDVTPFSRTGQLRPGARVARVERGTCWPGSDVLWNNVYRCISRNAIMDPCWRDFRASRPSAICMLEPWSHSATRLNLKAAPPPTSGRPNLKAEPWGIETASGARCLAAQGAHDSYVPKHGRPAVVDYYCGWGIRKGELVLLRGIDRKHPAWTIRSARYTGKFPWDYKWAGHRAIRIAWFGGNNPLSHRP